MYRQKIGRLVEQWTLRVSYNGYYVSFPRMRREFDSLHPHQRIFRIFARGDSLVWIVVEIVLIFSAQKKMIG